MRRIVSIKKLLFIFFSIIVMFIISNYDVYYNEEIQEVSSINNKKEIISYKRVGSEKAIYKYNIKTKTLDKTADILSEYGYIDEEISILGDHQNNSRGIYISNIEKNEKDMLLKGYNPISEGRKINNNIIFLAEGIYKKTSKLVCIYNIETKTLETKEIEAFKDSYIRDVYIVDGNTFIYSKKIKSVKDSLYKIYTYDFKSDIENEIISEDSHVINPVLSNDKNKISYIKKDINTYNLYLLNRITGDKFTVSLGEGVVGGSVKWSSDDKRLMCVTANGGYNDILNIISVDNKEVKRVEGVYCSAFTNNDKEIIGASYNIDESLQEIYKINIETNERKLIHSFYEGGSFSRSIDIKEYIGS